MILGFKTQFVPLINSGSKIHTIRKDKNERWKKGNTIHFATGVRTSSYNQFKETGVCYSTQEFKILWFRDDFDGYRIYIDDVPADMKTVHQLAKNDGFDSLDDFLDWFKEDFYGKIIHWTKFKY